MRRRGPGDHPFPVIKLQEYSRSFQSLRESWDAARKLPYGIRGHSGDIAARWRLGCSLAHSAAICGDAERLRNIDAFGALALLSDSYARLSAVRPRGSQMNECLDVSIEIRFNHMDRPFCWNCPTTLLGTVDAKWPSTPTKPEQFTSLPASRLAQIQRRVCLPRPANSTGGPPRPRL